MFRMPLRRLSRFIQDWLVPPKFTKKLAEWSRHFGKAGLTSTPARDPLDEYRGDDWVFLRQALAEARVYLEYGVGHSTEFVSKEYCCSVRGIESSEMWCSAVRNRVGALAEVVHIDVGETGDWGRPLTYKRRLNFIDYFEAGFKNGYKPEAILIDGRFRVACFLTSLIHAAPGSLIVFDDYPYRPHYHVVEEVLEPLRVNHRQAIFERPTEVDLDYVTLLRNQFSAVMD